MQTLISKSIKTPLGSLLAATTDKGLCLLEFAEVEDRLNRHVTHLQKLFHTEISTGSSAIIEQLETELEAYFKGKRQYFDVPLDYRGTDFQEQSWEALLAIPYGETRSYQDQAIAIEKPTAVRAVAGANNRNKISIVVPCHRVIGKNGSLTGYGGDMWRKEFLLKLEGAI